MDVNAESSPLPCPVTGISARSIPSDLRGPSSMAKSPCVVRHPMRPARMYWTTFASHSGPTNMNSGPESRRSAPSRCWIRADSSGKDGERAAVPGRRPPYVSRDIPLANRDGRIDQDWAGDDQDWWPRTSSAYGPAIRSRNASPPRCSDAPPVAGHVPESPRRGAYRHQHSPRTVANP